MASGPGPLPPCEVLRAWPAKWDLAAVLRAGRGATLPPPARFLHDGVEARASPHRGRHLVAARPLRSGKLVLADAPLAVEENRQALAVGARRRAGDDPGFRRTLLFFSAGKDEEEVRRYAQCNSEAPLPMPLVQCIVCHNSHEVERPPVDGRVSEAAPECGLWPLACLANHSLRPNLTRAFLGHALCYRLLRDVQAGEELVENYLDPRLPQEERSAFLQRSHGIADEGPDSLDAPRPLFAELERSCAEVRPLLAGGKVEEARRRLLQVTERCRKSGCRDPAFTDIFWLLADVAGQLLGDPQLQLQCLQSALGFATAREPFSSVSCCLTAEALRVVLDMGEPAAGGSNAAARLATEAEAQARRHAARIFGPGRELFALLNPGLCKRLGCAGLDKREKLPTSAPPVLEERHAVLSPASAASLQSAGLLSQLD